MKKIVFTLWLGSLVLLACLLYRQSIPNELKDLTKSAGIHIMKLVNTDKYIKEHPWKLQERSVDIIHNGISLVVDPCDTSGCEPVLGYRFNLTGDFDGDGSSENLVERFTNKNGAELNKYLKSDDNVFRDQCMDVLQNPVQFLWSEKLKMDTLYCDNLQIAQNLGDLDEDGGHEIGIMSNNGDYSSLSSYNIYSLKNGSWKKLLSIAVWEWMFPPTPQVASVYYPFGHLKDTLILDDTLNAQLEVALNDFKYITKTGRNEIEFEFRNDTLHSTFIGTGAESVVIKYNLKSNQIKIKFPDFYLEPDMFKDIVKPYKKINSKEYLVDGYVYYRE